MILWRKWHFAQEWVSTVHHQACQPPQKWEPAVRILKRLKSQESGKSWLILMKRSGGTFSRRDSTGEPVEILARHAFFLLMFSSNFSCLDVSFPGGLCHSGTWWTLPRIGGKTRRRCCRCLHQRGCKTIFILSFKIGIFWVIREAAKLLDCLGKAVGRLWSMISENVLIKYFICNHNLSLLNFFLA